MVWYDDNIAQGYVFGQLPEDIPEDNVIVQENDDNEGDEDDEDDEKDVSGGQCPICRGFGPSRQSCCNCEDTGMVYETMPVWPIPPTTIHDRNSIPVLVVRHIEAGYQDEVTAFFELMGEFLYPNNSYDAFHYVDQRCKKLRKCFGIYTVKDLIKGFLDVSAHFSGEYAGDYTITKREEVLLLNVATEWVMALAVHLYWKTVDVTIEITK